MKKYRLISEEKLEKLIERRLEETSQAKDRSYERDILMKQANIKALQSQINPHFLYNSLECIRAQAMLDGFMDIADITQALSYFFRYSISSKSNIVTLREELQNVRNYITIQQYRFKGKFTYDVSLEDEDDTILNALLPKLTLQPLVENAIIHGFSDSVSGKELKLSAYRADGNVSITISDNGKGMSKEQLDYLRHGFTSQSDENYGISASNEGDSHSGIGLANVDRRIKLYFGDQYGISITSCVGVGTDVELLLPYRLSVITQ